MSEASMELSETAERLFRHLAGTGAGFDPGCEALIEAGFPSLLVPEAAGGFGGDWEDAVAVLRLAGYHGLELPVAEMILAQHAATSAELKLSPGLAVIAARATGDVQRGRFTGKLYEVAAGRHAELILASLPGQMLLLRRAGASEVIERRTPAEDARDVLVFQDANAQVAHSALDLFALGAVTRVALMAGALDATLERSIAHANERVQFGRPIAKFQVIQQNLAVLAAEAAAVNCAAQAMAKALQRGTAGFEIAAAKTRANMASATGVGIAHQIHGAIGFTREFGLHRWTRRLLTWAAEFGSERHWTAVLGGEVALRGADALWPDLTARSDALQAAAGA